MSILNVSFNHLMTHMVCCVDDGYIVYSLTPDIEKKQHINKRGGVGLMKMLDKTNISIIVGGGDNPFVSKNVLNLWDAHKKNNIIEIDLGEPIRNVMINREKIVAVLEKKVCLFEFDGTSADIKTTYSNERGVCALNTDTNANKQVLVTLGTRKGEIAIWQLKQDSYKTIQAHQSNIETVCINVDGSLVGSVSEKGTLIKVFSVTTCKKLFEFRRGTTQAKVHDISFNHDSSVLACVSGNGTVHLFEMKTDMASSTNNATNNTKNTQSILAGMKGYLPEYFGSQWCFKQFTLESTQKMICNFSSDNVLHIVCVDGYYYRIDEYSKLSKNKLHVNTK